MVAQWRQHLKPGERVHGIITHGGAAPNIVPDLTAGRWYLRTPVDADLDAMIERFGTMAARRGGGHRLHGRARRWTR